MSYISCALRAAAPRRLPAPWRSPRPFSSTAGPPAEKNVPYQKTLKEEGTKITGPSRPLPPSAEVVVVGGGSLGCQTTYHLAKLGVTSVVLLERDRLTSGTTWHTAGEQLGLGPGQGGGLHRTPLLGTGGWSPPMARVGSGCAGGGWL